MTRPDLFDGPSLSSHAMILATDLDGTFLGGTQSERRSLYDWIDGNRDSVGLIFVTGRDPAFLSDLILTGEVPAPDYIIGDVGTTIARLQKPASVAPIEDLEAQIRETWGDRGATIRALLAEWPGLTLQPEDFRHRVSFDLDPDLFDPAAQNMVEAIGLDWLISDNRFFDVLPKNVSKGPSLLRLIEWLGVGSERVLCAGDTLNDLSMLGAGLPAVAVGNSEAALTDALSDVKSVYLAERNGAAGIAEAIAALELHPNPPVQGTENAQK
jgi:HAD superfamily hydrolase (TIGR01484 family)